MGGGIIKRRIGELERLHPVIFSRNLAAESQIGQIYFFFFYLLREAQSQSCQRE